LVNIILLYLVVDFWELVKLDVSSSLVKLD